MTNKCETHYTGFTGNLEKRVYEHKHKMFSGFTSKYNITKLDHFEEFGDVHLTLAREKQIKSWLSALVADPHLHRSGLRYTAGASLPFPRQCNCRGNLNGWSGSSARP